MRALLVVTPTEMWRKSWRCATCAKADEVREQARRSDGGRKEKILSRSSWGSDMICWVVWCAQ